MIWKILTVVRCDLGQSEYGTKLNGKRVTKAPLAPGDVITMAYTTVTLEAKHGLFSAQGAEPRDGNSHEDGYVELKESESL